MSAAASSDICIGRLRICRFRGRIRDELVDAGRARPHHILPDSGWVTVPMRTASEVQNVIELFRENYERYRSLDNRPAGTQTGR